MAEKFEAIVDLGEANSRMKDYYDLVALSRLFAFDGAALSDRDHHARQHPASDNARVNTVEKAWVHVSLGRASSMPAREERRKADQPAFACAVRGVDMVARSVQEKGA